MPLSAIKMLALGCGGATFVGVFGLSLASFAESGSFEFYKRQAYTSPYYAQSEAAAEPPGYSISPPGAMPSDPAEMIAAPRAVYSPGYPGDSWTEDLRPAPIQKVAYQPIARDEEDPALRVIPETGGSWTEPARGRSVARAEEEDAAYVEQPDDDGYVIEEPEDATG